jgi:serine/threonine-protein kinase
MDATRSVAPVGDAGNAAVAGAEGDAPDESGTNRTRNYAIILGILVVILLVAGYLFARNLGYLGGDASFNLPSVVGQPAAVATATLRSDGLNVTQVQQVSSDAPGTVISTNPVPDSLVKKGDTVTLKVAIVAPPVQVTVPPGLTNTTQASATAILQSAGLTVTIVNKTSSAQKGTVLSTNPTSGTKVDQGSAVTLTVSSGPANAIVPSLVGLSQAVAGQTLANAGLVVGNVTSVSSTQYQPGQVVSSNPGTGASVPPGSAVDIAVSTGPPATTTTTSTSTSTTTTTSTTSTTAPKGGQG